MPDQTFSTLLLAEHEDHVTVTLDRPAVRNAINAEMVSELHAVCARLEAKPQLLLLTGSGGSFAGGADIGELRERGADEALAGINRRLFDRVARLPMPTVAAVDGPALGGGAELAYACDLRLVSTRAFFGNPEPGLGIVAAAGASWRLAELVGTSVAKQILLGGLRVDARAAVRCGLAAEALEPEALHARATELVRAMATWSPAALRMTKLLIDARGGHPALDDVAQAVLFEGADKQERMTAFLEGGAARAAERGAGRAAGGGAG